MAVLATFLASANGLELSYASMMLYVGSWTRSKSGDGGVAGQQCPGDSRRCVHVLQYPVAGQY